MKQSILNIFQHHLDDALKADRGISVTTSDVESTKRYLYKAIRELKDQGRTEYGQLKIVTPPSNATTTLWLVKKEVEDEQPAT